MFTKRIPKGESSARQNCDQCDFDSDDGAYLFREAINIFSKWGLSPGSRRGLCGKRPRLVRIKSGIAGIPIFLFIWRGDGFGLAFGLA